MRGDLTGKTFGRWTVLGKSDKQAENRTWWECLCSCGKAGTIRRSSLVSKATLSCGCLQIESNKKNKTTHGLSRTKVYCAWESMLARCLKPQTKNFHNYGGRGIKVCKRWMKFENFLSDMGEPPTKKHSLDRIETDGNYEPGNCRWATNRTQQNNRRNNRRIVFNGETLTMTEWSEVSGVPAYTIFNRLKRGWSIRETLMGRSC